MLQCIMILDIKTNATGINALSMHIDLISNLATDYIQKRRGRLSWTKWIGHKVTYDQWLIIRAI